MSHRPRVSIHLFEASLNLGPDAPWRLSEVGDPVYDGEGRSRVAVELELVPGRALHCPECGAAAPRYDARWREWRHTDIFEHQCWVRAEAPRVQCAQHGVRQVAMPWAEPRVAHSLKFEAQVIGLLLDLPLSRVAERTGLSWPAINGVLERAVRRGLARRNCGEAYPVLAVDEVAFRKRHRYFTVVTDPVGGRALYVAEGRRKQALAGFYATLSRAQRQAIRAVSMDMWQACIQATLEAVPGARRKIAFDRFHVSKRLNAALNQALRAHLWGIVNAVVLKVSNGPAESMNSRIKMVKVRSRGFRSAERFGQAILFHLGGLALYPAPCRKPATHTEC